MRTLQSYQHLFDTDLDDLLTTAEDDLEFISQGGGADLLIEKTVKGAERFNLLRILDCNGPAIEIEHCGAINRYTWETIHTEPII